MDRLTERFSNGQAAVRGCGENCEYDYKHCKEYTNCPTLCAIYEKLAQYEETGLTPDQIKKMNSLCRPNYEEELKIRCAENAEIHKLCAALRDENAKLETKLCESRKETEKLQKENFILHGVRQTLEVIFGRSFGDG